MTDTGSDHREHSVHGDAGSSDTSEQPNKRGELASLGSDPGANVLVPEEFLEAAGRRICYDLRGDPQSPTVLLIMGLGLPMIWWQDEFCDALAARGLRVLRFDNRDVGRSTHYQGRPSHRLAMFTRRAKPAYTLGDMADDAAMLSAHVAPQGVHVVGVSLGALIAQELAIRHSAATRSLTSIMGRPGDGRTGKSDFKTAVGYLRPTPRDPQRAAEAMVRTFQRIGSVQRTAQDDADIRAIVRRSAERSPGGDDAARQFAAAARETDRTAGLHALQIPALVMHGDRDRVIRPDGGRATADALPNATFDLVPGMGHDLPRWLWPRLIDGIAMTVARAT